MAKVTSTHIYIYIYIQLDKHKQLTAFTLATVYNIVNI